MTFTDLGGRPFHRGSHYNQQASVFSFLFLTPIPHTFSFQRPFYGKLHGGILCSAELFNISRTRSIEIHRRNIKKKKQVVVVATFSMSISLMERPLRRGLCHSRRTRVLHYTQNGRPALLLSNVTALGQRSKGSHFSRKVLPLHYIDFPFISISAVFGGKCGFVWEVRREHWVRVHSLVLRAITLDASRSSHCPRRG